MLRTIEISNLSSIKKFIWNNNDIIQWIKKEETKDKGSLFQVSYRVAFILLSASGKRLHDF